MPWKECNHMDEKLRFVARLLDGKKMAPRLFHGGWADTEWHTSMLGNTLSSREKNLQRYP